MTLRTKPRLFQSLLIMLVAAITAVAIPAVAWGHGYTTDPISRAVWCQRGVVKQCGPVQYEPQSVEGPKGFPKSGPKDGKICSAGNSKWAPLDSLHAPDGSRWPQTTLHADTDFTFIWYLTAPHATTSFREFITVEGWEPGDPITRATLEKEPFAVKNYGGKTPGRDVEFSGRLPDRSGPAVIVSIWDIADTPMAFYQCADVYFNN